MNPDYNEITIRNKPYREPMEFERLKFLCWFIAGIVGEILGFALVLVIVLAMAGVFK